MSRTTVARVIVRAVASPPWSRPPRHRGHPAGAADGSSADTAASATTATKTSCQLHPRLVILRTSFRFGRGGLSGGGRFRRGARRAVLKRAEAVGEDDEEEADADDENGDERQHEAHPLEPQVHEVGDDQRG